MLYLNPVSAHMKSGEQFIEFLQTEDLLDRRYVNEDSVIEHPFNMSWLTDPVLQTLPLVLPLDPTDTTVTTVTTKKTSLGLVSTQFGGC